MEYLETIKNITKDKKRKKENLILLLILLIILLISCNYIFKDDDKINSAIQESGVIKEVDSTDDLEKEITKILNEINGVENVSVIINYSDNGRSEFVYDTKESYAENGNIISIEKNIAYNDNTNGKNAIVSIKNTPKVEGVIIVGNGMDSSEVKQKISLAVGNLLGISSYKVHVFSK